MSSSIAIIGLMLGCLEDGGSGGSGGNVGSSSAEEREEAEGGEEAGVEAEEREEEGGVLLSSFSFLLFSLWCSLSKSASLAQLS